MAMGFVEEFVGTLKMRDMKLRNKKNRHQTARMENARHENAGNAFLSSYPQPALPRGTVLCGEFHTAIADSHSVGAHSGRL